MIKYNRFVDFTVNADINKVMIEFDIENGLDLKKYCLNHVENSTYDLFAMIDFFGKDQCGHVISSCKVENNWYQFNDGKANLISPSNFLQPVNNNSNYMLYFKLRC